MSLSVVAHKDKGAASVLHSIRLGLVSNFRLFTKEIPNQDVKSHKVDNITPPLHSICIKKAKGNDCDNVCVMNDLSPYVEYNS